MQVIDQLTEKNLIEACEVRVPSNNKTFEGWRSVAPWLVSAAQDTTDHIDNSLLNGAV